MSFLQKKQPQLCHKFIFEISEIENPESKNIPKVVKNEENFLIYMSRSLIQGQKINKGQSYFKQVCIYGFSKSELDAYLNYGRKSLLEKIETLRYLGFLN